MQDLTNDAICHEGVTGDVDEYGLRRAWKLSSLTRSYTTPTLSSRITLPCELTQPHDSYARAVARSQNNTYGSTCYDAVTIGTDERSLRRAWKLS